MKYLFQAKHAQRPALLVPIALLVVLAAISGCKDRSRSAQSSQATNVSPAATTPAEGFKQGGRKIAEGAQDIGQAVGKTAVKTWDSVKTGAEKAGEEIKKGAQKTGAAIKDTAEKVENKFKSSP